MLSDQEKLDKQAAALEENQKTLVFLKDLSEEVNKNLRESGSTALLNRLCKRSGGFQYYFTNVVRLGTLTEDQFATQRPDLLTEATLFRHEYEASLIAEENSDRLSAVEAGLQQVLAAIKELKEAQAAPAEVEESKKPAKKAKKQADPDPEPQETEDDQGDEATEEPEA